MKKLLGISLVAVLAISPLMASAADVAPSAIAAAKSGLASNGTNVVTATNGKYYAGETITDADKAAAASAAYVKGAYNAGISAINKVAETADAAATAAANALVASDITEGATNGTIAVEGTDVAVHGLGSAAYTASTDYATAAQGALADSAVQSVAEGATNGTVSVDGTDVAVHGLGSAAYTASTDYATAAQGALADSAVQSVTTGSTAGTISVDGTDVAVNGVITDLTGYATETGVAATVNAATGSKTGVSLAVSGNSPMFVNWGDNSATGNLALANGATATGDITGIDVSVSGYTAGTGNGN